jgi:hypothetical protein
MDCPMQMETCLGQDCNQCGKFDVDPESGKGEE